MASAHEVPGKPKSKSLFTRILTTDFCPWANRFVYWLKEPIGWFVLATAICCMIGLYYSPIGWTLATSLVSIMAVGMLWPLIAVQGTRLELSPEIEAVHEDSACRMMVQVRNRLPIPVWGLAIEGYLDGGPTLTTTETDEEQKELLESLPTVGLASVPPLCQAKYGIDVHPSLRGQYPRTEPKVSCSFPFGIWTARKKLSKVSSLTVWPKVYFTPGLTQFADKVAADIGEGIRSGRDGDVNGVREYRRGDSAKHVNWVASARMDSLMITERSAPQTAVVDVILDCRIRECGPDELTRRIRIAASIFSSLQSQNCPMRIYAGGRPIRIDANQSTNGKACYRQILDQMASIPLDGLDKPPRGRSTSSASIEVSGNEMGSIVSVCNPTASKRLGSGLREWQVDPYQDLATAMQRFWKEVGHVESAA